MPEVQQIVKFSKKDVQDLLTEKAKNLTNAGAGSSKVEFAWPDAQSSGEGSGREADVIATVLFVCNGVPKKV
jgi:hypothetical protein